MACKLTLIEYDRDIFDGDDMNPDIQYRGYVGGVLGGSIIQEVDNLEIARRIEDMRVYARQISSSSSSSSMSSSSEAPQEELFEHHETGGGLSYTIGRTSYSVTLAQTFTPDISHQISRVELELFDNQGDGITGDITVEIKATSGGLPTGDALASGTIDAADLNPAHTYDGVYRSNTGGTGYLQEVCFSTDGLHMYSISYNTSWSYWGIHHYILSAAWDITTATLNESHELDQWDHEPMYFFASDYSGIYLKPDGTRIYIVGNLAGYGSYVWRIDLDTPYYITAATPHISRDLFATKAQYSCWFNPTGTRLFTADNLNDSIFQYNMSSPWDITTISSTPSQSTDISAYTNACKGVAFSNDGLTMQVIDGQNHKILFWNLSSAFNLSGESKASLEIDISGIMTSPTGCFTKAKGNTYFVCDNSGTNLTVYEFELHGDFHSADLGEGYDLEAETKYVIEATYDSYEEGVSEPEWVVNSDGDDNYEAGTMLRHDGSNWYDS